MKAIIFTEYGSPDHLHLKEVKNPTPKDNEVLVRIYASSVNSWDWEFLNGTPFYKSPHVWTPKAKAREAENSVLT